MFPMNSSPACKRQVLVHLQAKQTTGIKFSRQITLRRRKEKLSLCSESGNFRGIDCEISTFSQRSARQKSAIQQLYRGYLRIYDK